MQPDSEISILNDVIGMCRNGQAGFAEAASVVSDSHLRKFLSEYSEQRAQFALQLEVLVRQAGGEPDTSGSVAGALHRGWMDLKSAITGGDEPGILRECARGDETAMEAYRSALQQDLSPQAREALQAQCVQVEEALGKMAELQAHLRYAT